MTTAKTVFIAFGGGAIIVLTIFAAAMNSMGAFDVLQRDPAVLGASTTKNPETSILIDVEVSDGSGFSVSYQNLQALSSSGSAEPTGEYEGMVPLSSFMSSNNLPDSVITMITANGTQYVVVSSDEEPIEYVLLYNSKGAALSIIQDGMISELAVVQDISVMRVDPLK